MVPYWPDVAKNPAGQTTAGIEFAQAFDAVDTSAWQGQSGQLTEDFMEEEEPETS
jgi:hypothetical protein